MFDQKPADYPRQREEEQTQKVEGEEDAQAEKCQILEIEQAGEADYVNADSFHGGGDNAVEMNRSGVDGN